MASKDWFRQPELHSKARLARSRMPFHRAKYLKRQGLTLTTHKRRGVKAGRVNTSELPFKSIAEVMASSSG